MEQIHAYFTSNAELKRMGYYGVKYVTNEDDRNDEREPIVTAAVICEVMPKSIADREVVNRVVADLQTKQPEYVVGTATGDYGEVALYAIRKDHGLAERSFTAVNLQALQSGLY